MEGRRLLAATAGIALDLNYGVNGHAVHDLASPGLVADYAQDAVLLPDESVVVVGNSGGWAVTRYTPTGQLDTSFGTGGTARLTGAQNAADVARQDDGKLVVGGYGSSLGAVVARYLPDGSLDPSFGDAGVAAGGGGEILSLTLLPDGKILAGGRGAGSGSSAYATLWRFNVDGSPDATFGTNGRLSYNQGTSSQVVRIHVALPDGGFVGTNANGVATRFAADGSPQIDYGGDFADVDLQPDGKIVAIGRLNGSAVRVVRFNQAGGLDPTFGTGGEVAVTVGAGSLGGASARGIAVLPDGKILVGAESRHNYEVGPETYEDVYLARLGVDGSLDANFGVDGRYVQALTDGTSWAVPDSLRELLLTPDGSGLVVVGVTRLRAPDEDAVGWSENHSLSRYALDVPVVVDGGGPYGPVDEDSPFAVSAAGSSYAGGSIVKYEWDTSAGRSFIPDAVGVTANLTLPDDEEDLRGSVLLRVTTSDGLQVLSQPLAVDVRNVAPTVQVTVDGAAVFGVSTTVRAAITDPSADSITGTFLYGDGKTHAFSTTLRAASPQNAYAAPGTYTVTVNVADDDGGTGTGSAQIVVHQIGGTVYDDDVPRVGSTRTPWGAGVTVYLDLDRDGTPDAGEPSTVTDADGDFGFSGLATGDYRVALVAPAGPPADTLPSQPDGEFVDVSVTSTTGGVAPLGLTRKSRATGFVFLDADADGTRDPGEGPAALWAQVQSFAVAPYIDLDHDGTRDADEPRAVTSQDAPGLYVFRGLDPGTYDVRLHLTTGSWFRQTYPAAGGGLTLTVPAGPPVEVSVAGEFGVQSLLPAITGSVFDDVDGFPGRSTSGEDPWMARWTMYDDLDNDGAFDAGEPTAVSDAGGTFRFQNVALGTHRIRPLLPPGWTHTSNLGTTVSVTAPGQVVGAGAFGVRHDTDRTLPGGYGGSGITYPPGVDAQGRRRMVYRFSEALGDTSFITLRISLRAGSVYLGDAEVVGYDPSTFAVTFALPPGLSSGEYSAVLVGTSVTDVVGNPLRSDSTQYFTLDASAPVVTGVFVSSTGIAGTGTPWTQAFRNFIGSSGAGDAVFGYRIVAGEQAASLPWTNLDAVSVRFSEHVNVSADDLVLRGVGQAVYGLPGARAFQYDPLTFTATWGFATAGFGAEKLLIDLDGDADTGVTDAAGNLLDGEWLNPPPTAPAFDSFPSGDGTAGGNFRLRLNVLPGDVNRSGGSVNAGDVTQVRNRQFTGTDSPGAAPNLYSIFHDVNGNGVINAQDVTLTRNRQFTALPDGEPTAPATFVAARLPLASIAADVNLLTERKRLTQ